MKELRSSLSANIISSGSRLCNELCVWRKLLGNHNIEDQYFVVYRRHVLWIVALAINDQILLRDIRHQLITNSC